MSNWQPIFDLIDQRMKTVNYSNFMTGHSRSRARGEIEALTWLKEQAQLLSTIPTHNDFVGGHTEEFEVSTTVMLSYRNDRYVVEHVIPSEDGYPSLDFYTTLNSAWAEFNKLKEEYGDKDN